MAMIDPIADMLTRIRNANQLKYKTVSMPASKIKQTIATVLLNEGYITDLKVEGDVKKVLTITLKYGADGERVISGLKRISKPSLRVQVKAEDLPRVLNGLGIALISTSKGIMTDKEARKAGVGGEVLAYIW